MTKRLRWTAEEVAQNLSDDDDDLADPDELLMEGIDDEFLGLELDSDYDDDDMDVHNQSGQHTSSTPYDGPDPDPALDTNSTEPVNSDLDSTPPLSPSSTNG